MVMFGAGCRKQFCLLLFAATCCAQGGEPGAPGGKGSQALKPSADSHTAGNPDTTDAARELFRQGAALIESKRFGAAIPLLRRAAASAPREGRIHHYLGYALWKTQQWSAASAEFETAQKLEPGNPYTEYFQARIAYSQG